MAHKVIDNWHSLISSGNLEALDDLLSDEVLFYSPVVHTPQAGKPVTRMYLAAAFDVFVSDSFRYVREIVNERDAVLEFTVDIDGVIVNGVDMIKWNDEDKLIEFKVMLRPLKAINLIHKMMADKLESLK